MTDLHELPEWQAWDYRRRMSTPGRGGRREKAAEALITKLAELVEEAEAKQHDVYYDLWLVENEALRKAEAIIDQWEVKAADLMRERNEARAEARTEILDSAWNTANERAERLAAELAELKGRRCEPVVLPDYEEARTAEDPSPLDRFIVDNEPAGPPELAFRDGLQEVVDWLTTTGRYERREA